MRIDLKWAIPFVLPFLLIALFRALFWFAGLNWSPSHEGIASAGILSLIFGSVVVAFMFAGGKHIWVTIGRGGDT